MKSTVIRVEEEKKQLLQESIQVKEMLKRELAKAESESSRSATIISEYKQVTFMGICTYYICVNICIFLKFIFSKL